MPRRANLDHDIRASSYLQLFLLLAAALFLAHSPFFTLPYFWDELGQFVPAALDIQRDGAWIPHSTVPNVHPPGVMAWLAGVWTAFGYSIPATRAAMLTLAAIGALFSFLLAVRLCGGFPGAPAFIAIVFLFVDPLFYTQSMMAQLDMPAMVGTVAALWLFLEGRHAWAALACTALVLAKETGILLPFIFLVVLLRRRQVREAAFYTAPFLVLAVWLLVLWRGTGHILGDPGFAHYNVGYALHPVRVVVTLVRRIHYLFIADFRWIGTVALIAARKHWPLLWHPEWKIVWLFAIGHVLLVSLLGGAELERYLLPVLPILYIATAAAMSVLPKLWRTLAMAGLALGLIAASFVNPPYPFPFENNLAMTDFVLLHREAARALEQRYAEETIYTAWPLTAALRRPEFGYVARPLSVSETSDLHVSTLSKLKPGLSKLTPGSVRVLVLYSRTWDPDWGVLRIPLVRNFLARFYEFEPQMNGQQCRDILGLTQVGRWSRRGQWVEVYARN